MLLRVLWLTAFLVTSGVAFLPSFEVRVRRTSELRPSGTSLMVLKWEASTVTESNTYMKKLDELASKIPTSAQVSRLLFVAGCVFNVLGAFLLEEDIRVRNQKICDEIIKLGPVSIKLGQSLSCRPDLCGEELSEELKRLTDRVPPAIDRKLA